MTRLLLAIMWVKDEELYGTQATWELAMAEYRAALKEETT